MADYVSILNKAVSGLGENSADNRQVIYQKARGAIDRKLRSMDPPPAEEAIAAQMAQLEEAINQVEGEQQLAVLEQSGAEGPDAEPLGEPLAAPEPLQSAVSAPAPASPPAPAPEPPAAPVVDESASASSNAPLPQGSPDPAALAEVPAPNPPSGFIDDVILIDGIGEKTRDALEGEGITAISQIAAMSDEQLAMVAQSIGSPGFEQTQEWKKQASEMLGGALPRSKTDQDRLSKLKEAQEAERPPVDETPAAQVEAKPLATDHAAPPAPEPPAPEPASEPPAPEPVAAEPAVPDTGQRARESDDPSMAVAFQPPHPEEGAQRVPPPPDDVEPQSAPVEAPETAEQKAFADAIAELTGRRPDQAAPEPAAIAPLQQTPQVETARDSAAVSSAPAAAADGPGAVAPPSIDTIDGDPFAPSGRMEDPGGFSQSETDFGRSGAVLKPKRNLGKTFGCLGLLALLGGAAYGGWLYREQVAEIGGEAVNAVRGLLGNEADQSASEPDTPEANGADTQARDEGNKDDSRLGSDEQADTGEADSEDASNGDADAPRNILADPVEQPAPADEPSATVEVEGQDDPVAGEGAQEGAADGGAAQDGTASGTQGEAVENSPGADAGSNGGQTETPIVQPAIAAGESAFLYEEAIGATGANRDEAGIVWTLAQEAPEEGAAPEAVIKGLFEVPARGLKMNVSIKRNVDPGLPASHIIELLFTAPADFSGGNIDNISRFVMKATEQARGESLVGVPARIDAGFFLIALNNLDQAQQTNIRLLESGEWIDIPVAYVTGRRGLITLAKGESGRKVFADALADWRNR